MTKSDSKLQPSSGGTSVTVYRAVVVKQTLPNLYPCTCTAFLNFWLYNLAWKAIIECSNLDFDVFLAKLTNFKILRKWKCHLHLSKSVPICYGASYWERKQSAKDTWAMLEWELEVSKMSKNDQFSLWPMLRLNFPSSDSEDGTCWKGPMDGNELSGCAEGMQTFWSF